LIASHVSRFAVWIMYLNDFHIFSYSRTVS
jgi:hypothetical protein